MTSRTNRQSDGRNQEDSVDGSPAGLEQRRRQAVERYLAGDPMEAICQEMSCSKSWLYKWKKRYQVTDPAWVQEHSRRPQRSPTKTPDTLEAEIVWLRHALSPDGSGRSARMSFETICVNRVAARFPRVGRSIAFSSVRQGKKKDDGGLDNSGNIEGNLVRPALPGRTVLSIRRALCSRCDINRAVADRFHLTAPPRA